MDRHTIADLDRWITQSDDEAHPEWFAEPPELPLVARRELDSIISAEEIATFRAAGVADMRCRIMDYLDELRDVEEGRIELGYYLARHHGGKISRSGPDNAHKAAMTMIVAAQKSAMHAGRIELIDRVIAALAIDPQETT
jgi:hypothetical protein